MNTSMTPRPLRTCPVCQGTVVPEARAGRFRDYLGVRCEIPSTLPVATCQKCGGLWFDGPTSQLLSDSFEQQRLAAYVERARAATSAVALIVQELAMPHSSTDELKEILSLVSRVAAITSGGHQRFTLKVPGQIVISKAKVRARESSDGDHKAWSAEPLTVAQG